MRTPISKKVRGIAKGNNRLPGKIIDLVGSYASVRLSNNGAILRALPVVGGPVTINQQVTVDYSGSSPVINAVGKEFATMQQVLSSIARMKSSVANDNLANDWRIMLFSGGLTAIYEINGTGLGDAIADAVDGDVIMVPATTCVADITVPEGVTLCGINSMQSIVSGTVTLSDRSELRDISVENSETDSSESDAVIGPDTGKAYILNCHIIATNCGTGDAVGVKGQAGDLDIVSSYVNGESSEADGYAISSEDGA